MGRIRCDRVRMQCDRGCDRCSRSHRCTRRAPRYGTWKRSRNGAGGGARGRHHDGRQHDEEERAPHSLHYRLRMRPKYSPASNLTVATLHAKIFQRRYGANLTPQRDLRATQGRQLAKGHHSALPGKGGGDLGLRPGDPGSLLQHQAALRHPPPPLYQDQTPIRLRPVFAGEHLRARQPRLPVLRRRVIRPAS